MNSTSHSPPGRPLALVTFVIGSASVVASIVNSYVVPLFTGGPDFGTRPQPLLNALLGGLPIGLALVAWMFSTEAIRRLEEEGTPHGFGPAIMGAVAGLIGGIGGFILLYRDFLYPHLTLDRVVRVTMQAAVVVGCLVAAWWWLRDRK